MSGALIALDDGLHQPLGLPATFNAIMLVILRVSGQRADLEDVLTAAAVKLRRAFCSARCVALGC